MHGDRNAEHLNMQCLHVEHLNMQWKHHVCTPKHHVCAPEHHVCTPKQYVGMVLYANHT